MNHEISLWEWWMIVSKQGIFFTGGASFRVYCDPMEDVAYAHDWGKDTLDPFLDYKLQHIQKKCNESTSMV